MEISQEHIELIEGYLLNNLADNKKLLVENLIQNDASFSSRFNEERLLFELIQNRGDHLMMENIALESKRYRSARIKRRVLYLVTLVSILGVVAYLLMQHIPDTNDKVREVKPILATELETGNNKPAQPIDDKHVDQLDLGKEIAKQKDGQQSLDIINKPVILPDTNQVQVLTNTGDKDQEKEIEDHIKTLKTNENPCEDVSIKARFNSNASCLDSTSGSIYLSSSIRGGVAPYQYTLNGMKSGVSRFEGLASGKYLLQVVDSKNCKSEIIEVMVTSKKCPRVIDFKISPFLGEVVQLPLLRNEEGRLQIYNEEGGMIYDRIVEYNDTWDGMKDGNPVPAGAYQYTLHLSSGKLITGFISVVP